MKKFLVFTLLVLFVLTIPAFAENAIAGERSRVQAQEKVAVLERTKTQEQAFVDKDLEEARAIRERQQIALMTVEQLRTRVRECKEDESADCLAVVRQAKSNANEFLSTTAERIEASVEKLKEKIIASEMPEEKKTAIIASLDAKLAKVVEIKENAAALTSESTSAEIKESSTQLRQVWREARNEIKENKARVIQAKIGPVVIQAAQLEKKLDTLLNRFKTEGKDISELTILIDNFKAKVEEAKASDAELQELFKKLSDAKAGEKDELMKEVTSKLRETQAKLKEARDILKAIVQKMKDLVEKPVEEVKEETGGAEE